MLELNKKIAGGSKVFRMEGTGSKPSKKKREEKRERRWWRNRLHFTARCWLISDKLIKMQSFKSLVSFPRNEGILKKSFNGGVLDLQGRTGTSKHYFKHHSTNEKNKNC